MSRMLTEFNRSDTEMQASPALSSPSSITFKFQFSKVSLIRMFSSTPEKKDANPFTALTVYQRLILIGLILLMAVVLQVPTIVYFTSTPPSTDGLSITDVVDFKTCSVIVSINATSQSTLTDFCPKVPPPINLDELFYNNCLTISLALVQHLHNVNLMLGNKQCNDSAVPFFCNAIFSHCGGDVNSTDGLMEECVEVRDNDCPIEWRGLENILDVRIPSCESYAANASLMLTKAPPLNCPDQFDEVCGSVCLPVCEEYSQVSRDAAIASDVLTVIFIIIGLIGGIVTLVACIFNREKMFKFPQVYVVYNTVNVMVLLTFYVLPLIFGRTNLLCSDSNLIEAFENPSGYCQAQGFVLQTGIMYFFGFLLFHLGHLLYAIAFPLKAKLFMIDYARIAHLVEMIIIIVLGAIPGIIIVSTSEYQFDGFLPHLCIPGNKDVFFYTLTLAIVIGATIGLSMLFIAFWILRQNYQLRYEEENSSHNIVSKMKGLCNGFSSPEKKLFILFWYYMLVLIILLALLTVEIQTANSISKELQNYFVCSTGGYKPECDVYRKRIESITWPSYFLDLASTLSLSFIMLSNLTYVLQINDIKKKLFKSKENPTGYIAS